MKKLLVFLFSVAFFLATTELFAQSTVMRPGVAFVKQHRDTLFMKYPDVDSPVQAYYLPTAITNITSPAFILNSDSQLAVIGMDTIDHYLLLAGSFNYVSTSNHENTSYQGLVSIPWPLSTFSLSHLVNFLLPARGSNYHPEGVISADGKQWWMIESSAAPDDDSLIIYHGYTAGNPNQIDSSQSVYLRQGIQMSNLALDTKNNTAMVAVIDVIEDPVQNAGNGSSAWLYWWNVGSNGSTIVPVQFDGALKSFGTNYGVVEIDSLFGLTVIPENDGSHALLGMTTDVNPSDNTINLLQVLYESASSFNFSAPPTYQIPTTAIPTAQNFFSGQNCTTIGYDECIVGAGFGQYGNGSDMGVNSVGGDSILFDTHEADNNCGDRDKNSAIYYYDYKNGNGKATLVYNDSSAQELQPVWIYMPYTIPPVVHYPGVEWQGTPNNGNFGTVDTSADSAVSLTFTIVDTAKVATTVDSVTITGANASQFTLTPVSSFTLQPTQPKSLKVTFSPTGTAGIRNAQLNVYSEGQNAQGMVQQTLTQSLSGTAKVDQPGIVNEDPALSASMSVQPNPFSSSVTVQLTAPETGALGILVHDALGRVIYRSDIRETGAGQIESFTFDAASLNLADGVYYVTAFLGDRQASRAVVFTK